MARRFRFERSMLNGHPGNVARAVRRVIVRGVNHGLIVTSTTDGVHAPRSWHKILPPRNWRGRAVDFGHRRPGTPEARAALVAFQRDLIQTHGADKFHEIYGPDNAANVKNGVIVPLVEGTPLETQHDTHVHVAPKLILPLPQRRPQPPPPVETVSPKGIALVAGFEGGQSPDGLFRPYRDPVGVWTQGYGHTDGVTRSSKPWTKAKAERVLRDDLNRVYAPHVRALELPLNQNQFDALVSFVFNLGPGAISVNTGIGRALRRRAWPEAGDEMLRWDKAGSPPRPLPGLTRRRKAERALFLSDL